MLRLLLICCGRSGSLLALLLFAVAITAADPSESFRGLLSDESTARRAAIATLADSRDVRLIPFLEQYGQGSAYRWHDRVVLVPELGDTGIPLDPLTREPLAPAQAKSAFVELEVGRGERNAARDAITLLRLADPDPAARLAAVIKAGDSGGDANRAALQRISEHEADPKIHRAIAEGLAIIDLELGDATVQAAAAKTLGEVRSSRALAKLVTVQTAAKDPALIAEITQARREIEQRQTIVRTTQTIFSGLSAGSILIIMALGLAITFGLMGVINMAHGEMLMIGAYATLLVQWVFTKWLPPAFHEWYFVVGVVAGFLAAGAVGWLLELTVIRHLYGRPLETLLATWGISYLLIQGIRTGFGDNQAVVAPSWLVGGWEPINDLVLPWNRLFIILLTIISVAGVWMLLNRTRLGLLLRATTQSRRTASSLGVDTRKIDGLTFALGSGLAGAAGVALTLIGGLKPDMGQEFIIDSFLVVATGGVGNLWGVVWAGLSLGLANKFLEPFTEAVYAKVIVLGLVILFLQWKPSGLFPAKGRLADA